MYPWVREVGGGGGGGGGGKGRKTLGIYQSEACPENAKERKKEKEVSSVSCLYEFLYFN